MGEVTPSDSATLAESRRQRGLELGVGSWSPRSRSPAPSAAQARTRPARWPNRLPRRLHHSLDLLGADRDDGRRGGSVLAGTYLGGTVVLGILAAVASIE